MSTRQVGSSVEIVVSGPSVRLVGMRAPNREVLEIAVDGVVVDSVDTWSADYEFDEVVWSTHGLSDGTHVVTVTFVGASASTSSTVLATVDAVEATG